jgi:hypothetical protein
MMLQNIRTLKQQINELKKREQNPSCADYQIKVRHKLSLIETEKRECRKKTLK